MNEIESREHLTDEEWFSLPFEVQDLMYQPLIREYCTHLQNWRHCRLPRCRRGKVCTGTKEMNKRDNRFPPCICNNDEHARLFAAIRRHTDALLEADQG